MATWTDTTTIKAGVTNGKPVIGTGGFGDQVSDNLQYLRDVVDRVGVQSVQSIHDDFAADTIAGLGNVAQTPPDPYTWEIGGTTVPALDGTPDHWAHFSNAGGGGAGAYSVIAASPYKMRFDLDRDHTLFCEIRHKAANADNTATWLLGFQDASLAVTGAGNKASITTQDNIIAFVQDATASKYDAVCTKATSSVVVANSVGTAGAWNILRIQVTFSGATKKVEFFVDGVSVGSTVDTAKIPVVKMRPLIGFANGGGTRDNYADYADYDWSARPLST